MEGMRKYLIERLKKACEIVNCYHEKMNIEGITLEQKKIYSEIHQEYKTRVSELKIISEEFQNQIE